MAVVYPNGITAPDANDDESVRPGNGLRTAPEVSSLTSPRYTFGLPIEQWVPLVIVVLVLAVLVVCVSRALRKRRRGNAAGAGWKRCQDANRPPGGLPNSPGGRAHPDPGDLRE